MKLEQAWPEGSEQGVGKGVSMRRQVGTKMKSPETPPRSPFLFHKGTRSCSYHVGNEHRLHLHPTPHGGLSQLLSLSPLTAFLGPSCL